MRLTGRPRRRHLASHQSRLSTFVAAASLLALLSSCADTGRTIVAPPKIAGAEYVGTDGCSTCHAELVAGFDTATHALLSERAEEPADIGCESCHGPGSLHVRSGGGRHDIINPRKTPTTCFQCHLAARGDFALPHSHPVTGGPLELTSGKMSCADCHESHSGPAAASRTSFMSENEACIACHPAQRGPFVFEHEALLEGCTTCHRPHGSVNAQLLTERNATLCLKCHFQEQTAVGVALIGGRDHSSFLTQGTCWSAGCHEAVHGSQVNSSLRF